MPIAPGSTFGRYVVSEQLGRGGMGEVYRAFDAVLERPVALKILGERASAGRGEQMMMREARAAAALQHPNVIAVYDLGVHEGVPFLAMELVRGRSLRVQLGRLDVPVERWLRWLIDVARALEAAHRAGMVHRDIKPENVMVSDDGVVKVLDFGIARHPTAAASPEASSTAETATIATLTAGGALVGTPPYMAPEQVRGREIDGRADQFAWGVVAYEVLAGRLPWTRSDSLFDVVSSVLHEVPRPLRELRPDVPEAAAQVVMRALAKNRDERFPTMGDVLAALSAFDVSSSKDGLPLPSDPDEAAPDAVTVTSAGRGDGALAAAAEAAERPIVAPSPPAETPPPDLRSPPRRRRALATFAALALLAAGGVIAASRAPRGPPSAVAVTLAELQPSPGCKAGAIDHLRRGMAAMRDGAWEEAHAGFERAAAADPGCASAAMRLSQTGINYLPLVKTREVYRRAVDLRADLSERDQLLLDALGLMIRSDPSDERGYGERLLALSDQRPGDAELACLSASHSNDPDRRIRMARRALAIDPRYSDAMQLIGQALYVQGKPEEAMAMLEQCVEVVPNSIDCVQDRVGMLRERGRCADAEAGARQWIARAPDTAQGYAALAGVLASEGRAPSAVEEALRQRWSRLPEPERTQRQLHEQALAGALAGDFAGAERRALELTRLLAADPSLEPHARVTLLRVELLVETDRGAEAAAVAAELRERKSAWSSAGVVAHGGLGPPPRLLELRVLEAARRGGRLPEAEWTPIRDRLAEALARSGNLDPAAIWAMDRAVFADTPATASEALLTMPPALTAGAGGGRQSLAVSEAFIGRTLLLAGRLDEAIRVLEATVASCHALDDPFLHTRAQLWLGQAREQKGATAEACAAYRAVVRRWGTATPSSTTALAARRRLEALACPPP